MDKVIDNLTSKQKDYAIFLPALSGFYANYIGRQRHDPNYVEPTRVPADFENGIEGMNYLNPEKAYFPYRWSLYSAGHAELDTNKTAPAEDMVRNRDRANSWVLGDSGGFQIAKGVWEADWKDPNCPKAQKKRELVLKWMDSYMDYGMVLDIPVWATSDPAVRAKTGISNFQEAVYGTDINNQYFMKNRTGACKFLNVLQGGDHAEADRWYDIMKHYCDPTKHDQPFEGWSMGGQNKCDIHLALRRLVTLRFDGLLEKGKQDWMHFLGTSKLEWALLLTDVQRAVRKYHNENFTVSFDCASPFLATANGAIYTNTETEDRKKWVYRTVASVDDKKYALDTRGFGDAVRADGIFPNFTDSPMSSRMKINDVCYYKPGDLNKIGKEGKTSWDSFSYALQMGHNIWSHITAVQQANRQYDAGSVPRMLVQEKHERIFFKQIVDEIFATSDRDKAMALIEYHEKYWMAIPGTGNATGKKTKNAHTQFKALFEEVGAETETIESADDDQEFDEGNLDKLEMDIV
jgi:hypothetical protein